MSILLSACRAAKRMMAFPGHEGENEAEKRPALPETAIWPWPPPEGVCEFRVRAHALIMFGELIQLPSGPAGLPC